MGLIIGLWCERLFGHRLAPWRVYEVPEAPEAQYARFEYAKCRLCRNGYVRPMPLPPLD